MQQFAYVNSVQMYQTRVSCWCLWRRHELCVATGSSRNIQRSLRFSSNTLVSRICLKRYAQVLKFVIGFVFLMFHTLATRWCFVIQEVRSQGSICHVGFVSSVGCGIMLVTRMSCLFWVSCFAPQVFVCKLNQLIMAMCILFVTTVATDVGADFTGQRVESTWVVPLKAPRIETPKASRGGVCSSPAD